MLQSRSSVSTFEFEALVNPVFCALIIRAACEAYYAERDEALPLVLAYLVLPLTLPFEIRSKLPRTKTAYLRNWVQIDSAFSSNIHRFAVGFKTVTRKAIVAGVSSGLMLVDRNGSLEAVAMKKKPKWEATEEADILKKAAFVGRWFSGYSTDEVYSTLGITL